MWGVFDLTGELIETHQSVGQAELAQNSFYDATTVSPVTVSWSPPRPAKKKARK